MQKGSKSSQIPWTFNLFYLEAKQFKKAMK